MTTLDHQLPDLGSDVFLHRLVSHDHHHENNQKLHKQITIVSINHDNLQTADVHVAPVHEEVQAHVFGAVQVPPFEQVGEHTARNEDHLFDSRSMI